MSSFDSSGTRRVQTILMVKHMDATKVTYENVRELIERYGLFTDKSDLREIEIGSYLIDCKTEGVVVLSEDEFKKLDKCYKLTK